MRRKKKRKYILPVLIGVIVAFTCILVGNGNSIARGLYPMMNDSWYNLLTNIRNNTHKDSVLNSWWDFGDWFKAVGHRRVIFDGQSQNSPQGYWMAKVLLSPSEEYAMRVLRMLNNSGNSVFDKINDVLKDPFHSLLLLERVLSAPANEVQGILSENLPAETVKEIMQALFGMPPPAYFIVDYSMIGKMPPISYLGNWDVMRLYIVKNLDGKSKEEILSQMASFGIDGLTAATLYSDARLLSPSQYKKWVSNQFRFLTGQIPGKRQGDIVLFDNGLVYNPNDQSIFVFNTYDGKFLIPRSFFLS